MGVIETHAVTKDFGATRAVDGLTLSVEEGEVYGFLGPNGAGKSTTIDLLMDYVRPTAGRAQIHGYATQHEQLPIRRRVGLVAERARLDGRLTARRHLAFAIAAHNATVSPDALLARVDLTDAADRPVRGFSTGMRQRLRLALAFVGDPQVLLLDEPANGLDPDGQRWLRELVVQERDRGTTVFISTHRLAQVEAVCDRVGILVDGRLRAEIVPEQFDTQDTMTVWTTLDEWSVRFRQRLARIDGVRSVTHHWADRHGHRVALTLAGPAARDRIQAALADLDAVETIVVPGDSLERAYTRLTRGASCES